jgi:acyl carrier protein
MVSSVTSVSQDVNRISLAARSRLPGASATETDVAAIWSDVFGIENPGLDDDFFDIGGHSIAAAAIAGKISEKLGHTLKLGDLAEATTIRLIARLLDDRTGRPLPRAA